MISSHFDISFVFISWQNLALKIVFKPPSRCPILWLIDEMICHPWKHNDSQDSLEQPTQHKKVSNHHANLLMIRHFDYCPSVSEGDNQSVGSSAPVVSRCFPGGYNVKLYISRGRLAWWLLAFLHSARQKWSTEMFGMRWTHVMIQLLKCEMKCLPMSKHSPCCRDFQLKQRSNFCHLDGIFDRQRNWHTALKFLCTIL